MASRSERGRLGMETVSILEQGMYTSPGNPKKKIALDEDLSICRKKSLLFRPDELMKLREEKVEILWEKPDVSTEIELVEESTLGAGRRLVSSGFYGEVACLNFASAKNPGGGFLSGSRAQEESLAMASGLYFSLTAQQVQEYYQQNRPTRGGMYKDYLIFSPAVPVIRDETSNELLESPYSLNFITMPAVNAGAAKKGHSNEEIESTMLKRMDCVLAVAAKMQQEALVLGAWGAGVFGNDPAFVAEGWKRFLVEDQARYKHVFKKITLAVLDLSANQETLRAFRKAFES